MSKMNLENALSQAKALPCWKDPQNLRPLDGGITNINILLTDQNRDYVVRMGQDIPEHGVMRFNELAISRAASIAGLSPSVHHAQTGAMVLDFVDAIPLTETDLHDPETLLAVTKLIARLHSEIAPHLRGPILTFWVFHVLRDYTATLQKLGSTHTDKLDNLMDHARNLEQAVGPVQLVLGHNDLLPANILRGKDQLWLIDWEYGGFNSPLFDLGGLATNTGLDPDAEHKMLTAYFGTEPNADLMRSYTAMKCASLLRETLWSMVSELTSEIDFNYADYTTKNLDRFQQAYSDFTR